MNKTEKFSYSLDMYRSNPYLIRGQNELSLEEAMCACEAEPMVYSLISFNLRSCYPTLADYVVSRISKLAEFVPVKIFTFEHLLALTNTLDGCCTLAERIRDSSVYNDKFYALLNAHAPELKGLLVLKELNAQFLFDSFQSYKLDCTSVTSNLPTF